MSFYSQQGAPNEIINGSLYGGSYGQEHKTISRAQDVSSRMGGTSVQYTVQGQYTAAEIPEGKQMIESQNGCESKASMILKEP